MSCPPGSLKSHTARHMNWVEEQGGLPRFIERIACHLHFDKGHDVGDAIATAVNVCKLMCATGETEFPNHPMVKKPGSREEACAAVQEWETKRAAADAEHAGNK